MELCKYLFIFSTYLFYFVVGYRRNVDHKMIIGEKTGHNEPNALDADEKKGDNQNFNYEALHKFGLGRKIIEDYRNLNPSLRFGYEHPDPLPRQEGPKEPYKGGPFHTIRQGRRKKGDIKVYSKTFDYAANLERGQHIFYESLTHCPITFLKAETDEGIPILLRGGVGYPHLSVIVKAHLGKTLKGRLVAYCQQPPVEMGYHF
ncbi:uncharacterized protein LOC126366712 isoform X2 [Pectinophora gossypiella]|nr:uncharacterized protein LOC126366712 isoform X2 [Pectinophora gossypiella]